MTDSILSENKKQFIVALTEHRVFGRMLSPFIIVPNEKGTFYTICSTVLASAVNDASLGLSDAQKELVKIIDSYSDENLARRFSKSYGSKEFFHKIDKEYFNKHVSPYIDKQIVKCVEIIKEHDIGLYFKPAKYSNIYDEDRISIFKKNAEAEFTFDLSNEALDYSLTVFQDGKPFKIRHKNPTVVTHHPCCIVIRNNMYCFETLSTKRLSPFIEKEKVSIPSSVIEKYLGSFVLNAIRDHNVIAKGFHIIDVDAKKRVLLSLEKGLDLEPTLVLKFQYGTKRFSAGRKGKTEVEFSNHNGNYRFYRHARNLEWEMDIIQQIASLGLKLEASLLTLNSDQNPENDDKGYALINWINSHKPRLKELDIVVEQNFPELKYYTGTQSIELSMKSEGDWFDIYAIVIFGDFQFPFIRLKKHILKGQREFELPNGEIAILPLEWFTNYKDMLPFATDAKDKMRFSKAQFRLLKSLLKGIDHDQLSEFEKIDPADYKVIAEPSELKATLRSYQREGYSWMHFLGQNKFGGCLADDMGLGKTLQTLTLLQKIAKPNALELANQVSEHEGQISMFDVKKENTIPASLIIVPTSLVHNWRNEISKFTTKLKVYTHIGSQRKNVASFQGIVDYYDIILTSYGTIRNDYEKLKNITFNYLILDESQYIKNPTSKTYKAVCALQSNHKLVLTGTPIENSLSDLWAQINFINRGLLGSLAFFKKEFVQPIEKKQDEEKQKKLNHLIAPFILRRTKEEVAKDLPPLTEQIRYCQMSDKQQHIYEEHKSLIRNSLLENIEKQGISKSAILVLQGLTKLRQLSNHPALIGEEESDSGKFDDVLRSLSHLMAENHKVLMFSSFVKYLDLFEEEFKNRNWGYCKLTGHTRDREKVIDEFQNNAKKRIFLISLKAGGVGLNLTSADYIFILDPWWNPAAENQAINRAHRIGQDKKVFVYRFIAEGSIEEKIQILKEKKSALADKFINSNNPFSAAEQDDLMDLFE